MNVFTDFYSKKHLKRQRRTRWRSQEYLWLAMSALGLGIAFAVIAMR